MTCFGIEVSGAGIESHTMQCGSGTRQYFKMGGLSPISDGAVEVNVVSGPARTITLFGLKSSIGCPNVDDILNAPDDDPRFDGLEEPYVLGTATTDIYNDTTVKISAKYDPANPKKMFEGCGGDGRWVDLWPNWTPTTVGSDQCYTIDVVGRERNSSGTDVNHVFTQDQSVTMTLPSPLSTGALYASAGCSGSAIPAAATSFPLTIAAGASTTQFSLRLPRPSSLTLAIKANATSYANSGKEFRSFPFIVPSAPSAPTGASLTFSANPVAIASGKRYDIFVNGATPPLSFSVPSPSGSIAATGPSGTQLIYFAPSGTAPFNMIVPVSDSAGNSGNLDIRVIAPSGGSYATQFQLSAPTSMTVGYCQAMTLQTVDGSFAPSPVSATVQADLGGSLANYGIFYSDSNCGTAGGSSITRLIFNPALSAPPTSLAFSFLPITAGNSLTFSVSDHVGNSGMNLNSATLSSLSISSGSAGSPTRLAYSTAPGATGVAGSVLSPSPIVSVLDSSNTLVTASSAAVTLSVHTDASCSSTPISQVGGTGATAVSGSASFAAFSIGLAGTGYYVKASATGLTPVCSTSPISISAASASRLIIQPGQPGQPANGNPSIRSTACEPWNVSLTDSYGNASGNSTGSPVNLALNLGSAVGRFYSDPTCVSILSSPSIGNGGAGTGFYLSLAGQAGTGSITLSATAASGGFTGSSQTFSIGMIHDDYQLQPGTDSRGYAVAIAPSGVIYTAGMGATGPSGSQQRFMEVRKSLDGGVSWSIPLLMQSISPTGMSVPYSMIVDPNSPSQLYVAGYETDAASKSHWIVQKSSDAGASWSPFANDAPTGSQTAVIAQSMALRNCGSGFAPGLVVVGLNQETGYTTSRIVSYPGGGGTSVVLDNGYSYYASQNTVSTDVAIASNGSVFVSGFGLDGSSISHWLIRKANDCTGGTALNLAHDYRYGGTQTSAAYSIAVDQNSVLYAAGVGGSPSHWIIQKSTDLGTSWALVDDYQLSSAYPSAPQKIRISQNGQKIIVTGYATDSGGFKHWITRVSIDQGVSWTTADDYTGYSNLIGYGADFFYDGRAAIVGQGQDGSNIWHWLTRIF